MYVFIIEKYVHNLWTCGNLIKYKLSTDELVFYITIIWVHTLY